jgi:hypothetical protein
LEEENGARLCPSATARGPWTEINDAALFDGQSDRYRSAAAAFLPTLAD